MVYKDSSHSTRRLSLILSLCRTKYKTMYGIHMCVCILYIYIERICKNIFLYISLYLYIYIYNVLYLLLDAKSNIWCLLLVLEFYFILPLPSLYWNKASNRKRAPSSSPEIGGNCSQWGIQCVSVTKLYIGFTPRMTTIFHPFYPPRHRTSSLVL